MMYNDKKKRNCYHLLEAHSLCLALGFVKATSAALALVEKHVPWDYDNIYNTNISNYFILLFNKSWSGVNINL